MAAIVHDLRHPVMLAVAVFLDLWFANKTNPARQIQRDAGLGGNKAIGLYINIPHTIIVRVTYKPPSLVFSG